MKNSIILLITLLFSSLLVEAQSEFTMSSIASAKLETLHSEIVGEDYKLLITLPLGFSSEKEYPVFYYLDAYVTSGMMNELGVVRMFTKDIDNVILVGISYEANPYSYGKLRERDYLPSLSNSDSSNGTEKFLQFIKTELIPYMEKNYAASPKGRGLMGYSLGGLFTTWVLKKEPLLFEKLAIISPSLQVEDGVLLKDEELLSNIKNAKDLKVIIACGSLEGETMISNANSLNDLIKSNEQIRSKQVVFADETHGSVVSAAMSRGLHYLYENEFRELMEKATVHYKKQQYSEALALYELAFTTSPSQIYERENYNIACLYALTGDMDQAFQHLDKIVKSNYDNYDHISADSDFNALHQDKRWNELLSKIKQNKDLANKN